MSIERLRALISTMEGTEWNDKVEAFAKLADRSPSRVYHWLSSGPPEHILNSVEYTLKR